MPPGRRPKPSWLRVISGNPGKRPLNDAEPMPAGELVEAPAWFHDAAKPEYLIEWRKALAAAPPGLLRSLDESMLVTWVVAKVLHAEAAQKVMQYGALIKTPVTGAPMQSPYISIMNRQAAVMHRASAEMGFSPSSRSRVSLKSKRQGKESNPFTDLKELGD